MNQDLSSPSRHPFQVFILVLSVIAGVPMLFGKVPIPGSLEEALPQWAGTLWAASLTLGAAVTLVGVFWPVRLTGHLIEQVGLIAVGSAAVLYGGVLFFFVSDSGSLVSASMISGYGAACVWRWFQLQRYIQLVIRLADERHSKD